MCVYVCVCPKETICMKCQNLFSGKNNISQKIGFDISSRLSRVVGCGEAVVYITLPGRPTDIGLQLGKACYPCST